jgi:hypothetical protein
MKRTQTFENIRRALGSKEKPYRSDGEDRKMKHIPSRNV